MQPDGKILLGGSFRMMGGQLRNSMARVDADGSLESDFNAGLSGGFPYLTGSPYVYAIVLQTDGKILVGGSFKTLGGQKRNCIGRLHADGSLDTGFNPGASHAYYPMVSALALQPDGKILVGGYFTKLGGQARRSIGRLHADGSLDSSFNPGVGGTIKKYLSPFVTALLVQADGKILVGGYFTKLGGQARDGIGRLNPDGSVDAGFHPTAYGGDPSRVFSLTLQADDKILVGGSFTNLNGQPSSGLARLNPNGSVDADFHPTADGGASSGLASLTLQADGKILVGGSFTNLNGQPSSGLARLESDGSVDNSFRVEVTGGQVRNLALQPDGRILVGGSFTNLGGQPRSGLARLNNTGPATDSLSFDGATVTWLRGGTAPEVVRVMFDRSTNGTDWVSLGRGTRVAGGWQLIGLSLPSNATIRARGSVVQVRRSSEWSVETSIGTPAIDTQPAGRTNNPSTTATFAVRAAGTGPFSYQWRKDGTDLVDTERLSGSTNATLSIPSVQPGDEGGYSVVAVGASGSVTSQVARLSVRRGPSLSITSHRDEQIIAGTALTLSGTASDETGSRSGIDSVKVNRIRAANDTASGDETANWSRTFHLAAKRNTLTVVASDGAGRSITNAIHLIADTRAPSVTIYSPDKNQRVLTNNAQWQVSGKAADDTSVSNVWVKLNTNGWQLARGLEYWKMPVTLKPGANTISVRAEDVVGRKSSTKTVKFTYVESALLTVQTNGTGKVIPNYNGRQLELGTSYSMTAKPGLGQVFSHWMQMAPGPAMELTNHPTLKFAMSANLVLAAHFSSNPFLALKGTYHGLFYPGNTAAGIDLPAAATLTNAGFFRLTVTDKGQASGKLLLAGQSHSFSRVQFDLAGNAVARVNRRAPWPALEVALRLDLSNPTGVVQGVVTEGTWQAEVLAFLDWPDTNRMGGYTFVLPGGEVDDASVPPGYGAGTLNVDRRGAVRLAGKLADGTPVSVGSGVSRQGWTALYASLQGGRGMLLGWVQFEAGDGWYDVLGTNVWIKGPAASAREEYYPAGFVRACPLWGARYVKPATGQTVLDWTNGTWTAESGNLSVALADSVEWANNTLLAPASTNKLKVTVTLPSGLFSGTFVHPDTRKSTAFSGAMLQAPGRGGGWFLGTNEGGRITIAPKE